MCLEIVTVWRVCTPAARTAVTHRIEGTGNLKLHTDEVTTGSDRPQSVPHHDFLFRNVCCKKYRYVFP